MHLFTLCKCADNFFSALPKLENKDLLLANGNAYYYMSRKYTFYVS